MEMGSRYERVLDAEADVMVSFDICQRYFTSIGYELVNSSRPSTLIFKAKSGPLHVLNAKRLNEEPHEISLYLYEIAEDQTSIKCDFDFPDHIGSVKDRQIQIFEPIFLALRNKIRDQASNAPRGKALKGKPSEFRRSSNGKL
jgi:hypothetical protein